MVAVAVTRQRAPRGLFKPEARKAAQLSKVITPVIAGVAPAGPAPGDAIGNAAALVILGTGPWTFRFFMWDD